MIRPILTNTVCQIDNGGQLKLVLVTSNSNPFFAASFSSSGGLFLTEPNTNRTGDGYHFYVIYTVQ